ncbi:MAG: OsmC family peroxiredoxin [Chitinophagales bacterium]|jgi:osmotically inducible protein OsmC|nr:OsmC family peroxiredoxin [Bacteroidota bacterium]MBP8915434.1 OsmC family peroxiredoxin [Chitinophagales bacterium]MBP9220222.1 OsmC family peroxiredoxin [Chitinophagales bacterium]MBP9795974.1 OsmC family peroxiredoxin [Chitinophagales bacterium]
MKRNGTAVWNGTGKEGTGHVSTQSGVLKQSQYSWSTRFADGIGTNPEELIAAAHAGCFSMKLSFVLNSKELTPDEINTTCTITLDNGAITESHLEVTAKVPGATTLSFAASAEEAKLTCPVSKLLNTTITLNATLIE